MSTARKTTVLITGCTPGGIGHALALEFNRKGCHVIATARRLDAIHELEPKGITIASLDVTNQESIAACKTQVEELTKGRLDILVNNAGRPHVIPALDFELDDARATYETNVFGPMLMVQAFISLLIPTRGLILNVSSASTEIPYLFGAVYSSSKGALNTWSRALRMELKPFHVRVMVSMTGTVRSNIASRAERELPESSLYRPVDDFYQRRLTFSQKNATMATEVFAVKLVAQALKGEGWLGGWIGGAPNYFWAGGMSTLVWISGFLPRWMSENATAFYFGIGKMARRIKQTHKKD